MGESESEDEFSDAFESHVEHENHEEQHPSEEYQEGNFERHLGFGSFFFKIGEEVK